MSGLLASLARFAVEHRAAVVALYLLISALLGGLGASIHLETSLAELLPRGTPSADDFRDYLRSGGTLDRLLISVRREPAGEAAGDEAADLARAAEDLSASLTASGLVKEIRYGAREEEVDTLTRFAIDHLPVLMEPVHAEEIASRISPEGIREAVAALRRRAEMPGFGGPLKEMAARDPLNLFPLLRLQDRPGGTTVSPDPATGLFLSADGRRLMIVAEPARPPTEIDFSRRLIAEVEAAEARLAGAPGVASLRFEHAGGHLFALEDERRVRHDAAFTSLFSFAGVGLVYLFVVRRPALWLAILVPLVMATVWTLGLASIYPGRLNMVTVAFAAVLLGIGDDAMLHIYLREREERAAGLKAPESAVAALRATGPAAVVATLTTAAAFLSLSFVRFRGLAELGVIGAMGMMTLLAGVIFFFPAALAYLGEREARAPAPSVRLPVGALLGLNRWAEERRRGVLIAFSILSGAMLVAASGVRLSTDLRSVRGGDPAAEGMVRLLAPYGAGTSAETMVVIHGSRQIEDGLEAAERLDAFCREGIASGRLSGCAGPAATMPPESLQRARFEAFSSLPWEAVVATLAAEARAAGMNESFFAPFTEAALRYGDFEAVKIASEPERFGPLGVPTTEIFFRDPDAASDIAAGVRARLASFPTRIASVPLVSADLGRILAADFRRAAGIVTVVILSLTLLAFRRWRLALLTLLPVGAGCVWMLGTARLLGIELNLMSLMGMPVVFGLGVDFGVYLVDRWAREWGGGRAALAGVGPAVLVTGLTTLAGFAALLSADLAGLRSLGFAVVAGGGYTLIAALVVLPLLLPPRQAGANDIAGIDGHGD